MSTNAYILRDDVKVSFDPDEVTLESLCDYCGKSTSDTRDAMIGEFRIGSLDRHKFHTHQTCVMDLLGEICREELTFLS